jgi:hypothetical protein
LLIAELGAQPTQATNDQLSSEWPVSQWKDIIKHSDQAIGACYFQFSDVEDKNDGKVPYDILKQYRITPIYLFIC